MKKFVILTAVAVMAAGHAAHAAGSGRRGGKPAEGVAREARDARADATRTATGGAEAASTHVIGQMRSSNLLTKLDPMDVVDLGHAMKNPEIMTAVRETAAQGKVERFHELASARVIGFAKIGEAYEALKKAITEAEAISEVEALASPAKKLQKENGVKAQAYLTLLFSAGKKLKLGMQQLPVT